MDNSEQGQAVPFITYVKGKGFALSKEAEDMLMSLRDEQLGVVSIAGKYRTGKSFFINRVLLDKKQDGFSVGPTINPCTKGLWLWTKTLKSENPEYPNMKVLLVDTEGFAGLDENATHDTRIFIFSLLLSSFFIYNSVGNIDESALNNLTLIINLAKEIQVKSGDSNSSEESNELAQYFPAFLWVVRDFALKLVDPTGNPISSKDYLETALRSQKGVSDAIESKNRIRRNFTHFFRDRDCCTMVRPLENEKDLQKLDSLSDADMRPEFVEQINSVRKRIFKRVKPKMLNGQVLNGSMLLEVIKAYIEAINTGKAPSIENAWTYMCKQESQKAMEDSMNIVDQKIDSSLRKEPIKEEELKNVKKQMKEEMLACFKKKSLGDQEEIKVLYEEIEAQFEERFSKFLTKNNEKWKQVFSDWIEQNSQIEAKLKEYQYSNFYEFKHELDQIKAIYEKQTPQGGNKEQCWNEYCQRVTMIAAEAISKKTEEQYSMQQTRMAQRLEMTETELKKRREEYETERNSLYNKIQEIERDRAIFKAQENNMTEKINGFKKDKEKYEQLYSETLSSSKQKEEKLTRETKERITELEQKLDSLRRETSTKIAELEKKNALLEQESHFIKRDNSSFQNKLENLEREKERFSTSLRQKDDSIEEYKRKLTHIEMIRLQETSDLKREMEKKSNDLQIEEDRRKESLKNQSEWLIEKSYLENQVQFLKSQLEENKRLHDALLLALEQGLTANDNDGTNELVETNKNLSAAVDKMEMRCKVLEDKNEKLKRYKRMIQNSLALQCIHCSKFIASNVFPQHMAACTTPQQATTLNKANLIAPITRPSAVPTHHNENEVDPNALQISIHQTMVKENSDSKPYTEYLIQVIYNGTKWSVSRKYKQFCELHQALNTHFPSLKFPESAFTVLGGFNNLGYISSSKRPTVIEERRKALQQYLRDLSKLDIVRNSNPFKKFLELERIVEQDNRAKGYASNMVSSREERRDLNNLSSERGTHRGEDLNNTQRNPDALMSRNLFSQSPLSFLKNWEEKAVNKENKHPRHKSVIDASSFLPQGDHEEFENGHIEELSSLSIRMNQDQDRSMNYRSDVPIIHQRHASYSYNPNNKSGISAYVQPALLYQPTNGTAYKVEMNGTRTALPGRNSYTHNHGNDMSSNVTSHLKHHASRPSFN